MSSERARDVPLLIPQPRERMFADGAELARGLAERVTTELEAALRARGRALLAVSGGNAYPAGAYVPPGGVTPPAISKSYIAFALPAK